MDVAHERFFRPGSMHDAIKRRDPFLKRREGAVYRASAHVHARVHPVGEGCTRGSARYEFLCTKVHVRNVIYRERSFRRARARTDA